MARNPKEIAEEIFKLVAELADAAGVQFPHPPQQSIKPSRKNDRSGTTGGIRLLLDQGKLNDPKTLLEIRNMLKQDARHYSNQAISMGLLNLARERVLTRLKTPGDKKWKYAIRK